MKEENGSPSSETQPWLCKLFLSHLYILYMVLFLHTTQTLTCAVTSLLTTAVVVNGCTYKRAFLIKEK